MCNSCEDSGLRTGREPIVHYASEPQWKKDRLRLAEILLDLDRCPHGRHYKDPCITCQKEIGIPNLGNGYLMPGTRIGTTLYGKPIVVPEGKDRYDPDAWISDE